jgi:uncharacterized protein with PQ loop repeat
MVVVRPIRPVLPGDAQNISLVSPATRAKHMENLLSVIGYIGTGLVIGAYAPQIWHLWTEQCSAGISERAYALWVLSSAVFLGHSITIGDPVFMVTQLVNIIALAIILVLARRFRNQICSAHAQQFHVKE